MKTVAKAFAFLLLLPLSGFSQTLSGDKVPPAIEKAFKAMFTMQGEVFWTKGNDSEYDAAFTSDGKQVIAAFDKKGNWKETLREIDVLSIPDTIVQAMNKQFTGYQIIGAMLANEKDGSKWYKLDMVNLDKEEKMLMVTPEGVVIKSE
ncbi:MAG TPA: PepSY-like domain-containing protein [Chitinophagales bacterium]|nr:PepSY-like domain-containing protein [Chitinophagales bacterium]